MVGCREKQLEDYHGGAYQHLAPVINIDAYMHWFHFVRVYRGAVLETRRAPYHLEEELFAEYGAERNWLGRPQTCLLRGVDDTPLIS